ncbi:MAG: 4Fe-4S dicluster domain-containing protein, partial [Armatimonadetes bacterium]|nr:4Fe-4S dicluster domain-containing protein [Armatimonadota bacterium]
RYCVMACPFDIPKYEWDKQLPITQKCVMCYEKRLKRGRQPACTEVCPTGAARFGDRNELIAEARKRLRRYPERYVRHIYGLHEAGGTSVLYLSGVPFDKLGFKVAVRDEAYPELTWAALSTVPHVVAFGTAFLFGVAWVINRRLEIGAAGEDHQRTESIALATPDETEGDEES